jgi:diaminopimelate decarboxylase
VPHGHKCVGCLLLQAASLGELQQALRVGFPPERVVFDSPAKTITELR